MLHALTFDIWEDVMTFKLGAAAAALILAAQSVWAFEAQQKTVQNGAAEISYNLRGAGPLIVILPSIGRAAGELAPVADGLAARGFSVALTEPRGIGGSTGPMEGVTFHDLAGDVAEVIRTEGVPAIIVGHAYGNWIAKTVAADHPELARGVVILAAGAKHWPRALLNDINTLNDPEAPRDAKMAALYSAFFTRDEDPEEWLHGWHAEVTEQQLAAMAATERTDWWRGGDVPMLDLLAGEDPFRPKDTWMETRDELGPRVTVKVIEGSSHALPAAQPQKTADAIADWAQGLDNPS